MIAPPDPLPDPPQVRDVMDPLADLLRTMKLSGGVFLEAEFSAPWCVTAQVAPEDCRPFAPMPAQVIAYHYVVAGGFLLQCEGEPPVSVVAGEIVVMPRNERHTLGSARHLRPVSADQLLIPAGDGGLARIVHGGGGERTQILCGFLGSDARHHPLLATLPKILKLHVEAGVAGDWITSSFRFAAQALRTGSASVLTKLAELLFTEAVRRYVATLPPGQTGWLAGLGDPAVAGALALMHGRFAEPWTTDALAREVGLSRSAFAERFTVLMREAPIRYLTRWRLQLAEARLRDGQPISQVAYEVGYESEAAFNRAFKREFGLPPAAWRRHGLAS
jgi:AraC-like DNA-binding protein